MNNFYYFFFNNEENGIIYKGEIVEIVKVSVVTINDTFEISDYWKTVSRVIRKKKKIIKILPHSCFLRFAPDYFGTESTRAMRVLFRCKKERKRHAYSSLAAWNIISGGEGKRRRYGKSLAAARAKIKGRRTTNGRVTELVRKLYRGNYRQNFSSLAASNYWS